MLYEYTLYTCAHILWGGGCLYYYRVISRVISCNSSHLIRRYFISLEIFPVSFTGGESNTCLTEWGNWLGRGRGSLMVQNINFTLCSCFESFPSHLLAAVMDIPNSIAGLTQCLKRINYCLPRGGIGKLFGWVPTQRKRNLGGVAAPYADFHLVFLLAVPPEPQLSEATVSVVPEFQTRYCL